MPGPPGIAVRAICRSDPTSLAELKALLAEDKFTFESERLTRFAELFGIANAGASYDLLQDGDLDDDQIQGRDQFVHIERQREPGDEFLESAAKKLMAGDIEGALADRRRAFELNPALAERPGYLKEQTSIVQFFVYHSGVKESEGDIAGALAYLDRAIELEPDSADFHKIRGMFKKNHGDLLGALADFDTALRLETEPAGMAIICNNRGHAKLTLGDKAGAMK